MLQPELAFQLQIPGFRVASPVQMAAIELYRLGFNVGPTKPASKLPYLWRGLVATRLVDPDSDPELFLNLFDNGAGIFVILGRLSMNLAILDCESQIAAKLNAIEFLKRGLKPWIVETARGCHFWWRSADGELANLPDDKPQPRGWEIRGNRCYCLVPPSIHPTGVIYQWRDPTGLIYEGDAREGKLPPLISIETLDWLPLKLANRKQPKLISSPQPDDALDCLSKRNKDFIEHGAPEGTRNRRLFACACDLAANGFSVESAREMLLKFESPDFSRSEIEKTLQSAYSKAREPAKTSKAASIPPWTRAAERSKRHIWQPIKGPNGRISANTARDVFDALCKRAALDHASAFRASSREVAEKANVDRKTARKAISCLVHAGFVQPRGRNVVGANLYTFGTWVFRESPNIPRWPIGIGGILKQDARADAFRNGALGKTAGRVWDLLCVEPLRQVMIAKRLRCSRATAKRAVDRLARWGLAKRIDDRRWVGSAVDDQYLQEVAMQYGTHGTARKRRERHCRERARFVSLKILRAKHCWAKKYLGGTRQIDPNVVIRVIKVQARGINLGDI